MLNMTSAYYIDQLAEKLQLMLATGELQISSSSRENSKDENFKFTMRFDLVAPQTVETVSYEDSDEKCDFNRMIQLLATKLTDRGNAILAHELMWLNPKKESNKL